LEIVGGILAFVYYPKAKQVALKSMAEYGKSSSLGKTVTAAWNGLQNTVR